MFSLLNKISVFTLGLLLILPISTLANYGTPNGEIPYESGPNSATMANINVTPGQSITLTNPLAGVSEIVANFTGPVTNGEIRFTIVPSTSLLGSVPGANPLLVINVSYNGVVKTNVSFKFTFKLKTTSVNAFSSIKAYFFNSPGTEFPISNVGAFGANRQFVGTAAGAGQYAVFGVGSTIVTGASVISTGFAVIIGVIGIIAIQQIIQKRTSSTTKR